MFYISFLVYDFDNLINPIDIPDRSHAILRLHGESDLNMTLTYVRMLLAKVTAYVSHSNWRNYGVYNL